MKNKYRIGLLIAALLLLVLPLFLLAQTTNGFVPSPTDEKIRDALGKYSLVKGLMVPLITVIIMALRKWIGLIPDQLWPWLSPFIGWGLDAAAAGLGFWTGSMEAGLAMGGLSVWFHQLGRQTKEVAKSGLTTTKPGEDSYIPGGGR